MDEVIIKIVRISKKCVNGRMLEKCSKGKKGSGRNCIFVIYYFFFLIKNKMKEGDYNTKM